MCVVIRFENILYFLQLEDNICNQGIFELQIEDNICNQGIFELQIEDNICNQGIFELQIEDNICNQGIFELQIEDNKIDRIVNVFITNVSVLTTCYLNNVATCCISANNIFQIRMKLI